eukprot:3510592-Rhodomonas_salina.3
MHCTPPNTGAKPLLQCAVHPVLHSPQGYQTTAMCLCFCYAQSGTEVRYAATRYKAGHADFHVPLDSPDTGPVRFWPQTVPDSCPRLYHTVAQDCTTLSPKQFCYTLAPKCTRLSPKSVLHPPHVPRDSQDLSPVRFWAGLHASASGLRARVWW